MTPKATVILCTRNRRRWLPRAIRSVLAQEHDNLQLIVCRDGGEPVRDIVGDFNDTRIDFIDRDANAGYGASLNECFARTTGQYVAYLGDDDLMYPNHLSVCVEAMEKNPGVGAAYTDLFAVHANVDAAGKIFITRKAVDISRDWDRIFTQHYNHVLGGSLVHRRELLDKIGPMDPNIRVLVDWSMIKRMAFFADFLHLYDITGEFWRINDSATSDRISDVQRRDPRVFNSNLRRIRGERPAKPWPMMPDTAILLPVRRITGKVKALLGEIADHTWCPRTTHVIAREWERGNLPDIECTSLFQQGQGESESAAILRCLEGSDADFAAVISPKAGIKPGWISAALYALAQSSQQAIAYPLANQSHPPTPFLFRRAELIDAMKASPVATPIEAAKAAKITLEQGYPDVPLSFDGGLTRAGQLDDRCRYVESAEEYRRNADQHEPRQWGNPLWMAEAQAREFIRGGRDDQALPLLAQLAQDRPTPSVLHLLAGVYRRGDMPDQARALYAEALAMLKE